MTQFWQKDAVGRQFPVDLRLDSMLVGETTLMRQLKDAVSKIAPSDASVMVQGPTGSGKEVVARALHALSGRTGALVALNCGAIPSELLESELFGHEKGAFTGADAQRIGLIEQANGGTLFLDEIAEMPAQLQVKLLRVLESRKLRRVGGGREIDVDFRLVSATHRNLEELVASGTFRSDLLFRINVFGLVVPALSRRPADIPLILRSMALNARAQGNVTAAPLRLTADALTELYAYDWPGNVRELRNLHDRAQILFAGREITAADVRGQLLSSWLMDTDAAPTPAAERVADCADGGIEARLRSEGTVDLRRYLQGIEEKMILSALEIAGQSVTQAADKLNLKRTTLIGKMQKLGIDRAALPLD